MTRLRVAAINFLNPAPLMWDFDHEPDRSRLAERYTIETMMPSACATRLASGASDLGLVPVTALATTPGLSVVPGCVIASLGPIRSILLVVKAEAGLSGVRTVAADTSSRASLAYTELLFRRFWGATPRFRQHAPDLDRMLEHADAALLIGDPALLALEERQAREADTGQRLEYHDLGAAWRQCTGMPWVSAVWALRSGSAACDSGVAREVVHDLLLSRDHGLAHREDLAREWALRLPVPEATIRTYLTENIQYTLDEDCLEGLRYFLSLAAECGILPPTSALCMLEP